MLRRELHLYKMEQIDNGDIHINNMISKMQMMKILIQELIKERVDDFTTEKEHNTITKEIFRIQTRLNKYQYKYDFWINEMVENVQP